MIYVLIYSLAFMLFFSGCAATRKAAIKPTAATEVVEAEGQAPIRSSRMI